MHETTVETSSHKGRLSKTDQERSFLRETRFNPILIDTSIAPSEPSHFLACALKYLTVYLWFYWVYGISRNTTLTSFSNREIGQDTT